MPEADIPKPVTPEKARLVYKSVDTHDAPLARILPQRDVALVIQHCRGRGGSEGDHIPYKGEREDGLDLIEHIRSMSHYNGEIFLTGGSYLASTMLMLMGDDLQNREALVREMSRKEEEISAAAKERALKQYTQSHKETVFIRQTQMTTNRSPRC